MLRREDYKTIKHMDKIEMETYLQRIYMRGYEAGVKSVTNRSKPDTQPEPPTKDQTPES